jgi:hypothetical protein
MLFDEGIIPGDRKSVNDVEPSVSKQKIPVFHYEKPWVLKSVTDSEKNIRSRLVKDEDYRKQALIINSMELVKSAEDKERIEGVEQLVAYPSVESEMKLTQLLLTDSNSEVRNAAALSLVSIKSPSYATIYDLISALEDESKNVRFSALSTLQDYILRQKDNFEYGQKIQSELNYKIKNKNFPNDTRDAINQMLKEN